MPIPSPRSGEKENEYIGRCMHAIGDEEDTDQQLAVCYSKWREHQSRSLADVRRVLAEPVRAVDGRPGRVKSYAAIWGDEEHPDWYGTWFTRDTDFALDWYDQRPWLYDHTFNAFVGAAKLGDWKDADLDDHGLFFLGELDARFRYLDEVEFLMELGYLFPSSGTLSHAMRVADDGWIQRWPVAELSSTVGPAEWRIPAQGVDASSRRRAAEAIRRLGGLAMSQDVAGSLFPGIELQAPQEEPTARATEVEEVEVEDAVVEAPAPGEEVEESESSVDAATTTDDEVRAAILSVDDAVRELFEEIRAIRSENEELHRRLQELERPPAEVLSDLTAQRNWTDMLFSATRSGRVVTNRDAGNEGGPDANEPLAQSSSLLTQLGQVSGGATGTMDILAQIVNSQRQ